MKPKGPCCAGRCFLSLHLGFGEVVCETGTTLGMDASHTISSECAAVAQGSQENGAEGNAKAYAELCRDISISLPFFLPEIIKLFLSLKV